MTAEHERIAEDVADFCTLYTQTSDKGDMSLLTDITYIICIVNCKLNLKKTH